MDEANQRRPEVSLAITSRLLTSLIGPGVVIKGTIKDSEDSLTIRGTVEGAIEHDQQVIVDQKGAIKADIKAKEIQVRGTVTGNLHGEERVRIDASGNVDGDIHTKRFAVEEGARMKGRVIMTSAEAVADTPKAEKTAAKPAEAATKAKAPAKPAAATKEEATAKGPKPASQPGKPETKSGTESKAATTRSTK